MDYVIGIILILAALFLVVAVLLQSGKEKGLSGAIGGGADTFFGKNKSNTQEKILAKLTTVIAIVFVVLVLVSFVVQDDTDLNDIYDQLTATDTAEDTGSDTGTDTDETSDSTSDSASDTTDSGTDSAD